MTDFFLLEQLHRMIKEIPKPRLMHNKGISVRGFFRPYMSFSDYTKAPIFSNIDEVTPVIVRFSSMLGDRGTADTVRNIKNMGIRFKTDIGDQDMICSSIPIQFIHDKCEIADICRIFRIKRCFDGINKDEFWRFVTDNPHALNCAVHLYSFEGLVKSYIDIKWYSVNTMLWNNGNDEKWLTRYKWVPLYDGDSEATGKPDSIYRNQAEFIAGFDPDIASNQLETMISNKKYPALELYIQMIKTSGDIEDIYTDSTLMWDEDKAPYMSAGIMIIDDIPQDNRFDDEMTFLFGNTVEGIELCRSELTDLIDHLCRMEGIERGVEI